MSWRLYLMSHAFCSVATALHDIFGLDTSKFLRCE